MNTHTRHEHGLKSVSFNCIHWNEMLHLSLLLLAFLWYKNCVESISLPKISIPIHLTTLYNIDVIAITTWLQIIKMVDVINLRKKKYFIYETMKKWFAFLRDVKITFVLNYTTILFLVLTFHFFIIPFD